MPRHSVTSETPRSPVRLATFGGIDNLAALQAQQRRFAALKAFLGSYMWDVALMVNGVVVGNDDHSPLPPATGDLLSYNITANDVVGITFGDASGHGEEAAYRAFAITTALALITLPPEIFLDPRQTITRLRKHLFGLLEIPDPHTGSELNMVGINRLILSPASGVVLSYNAGMPMMFSLGPPRFGPRRSVKVIEPQSRGIMPSGADLDAQRGIRLPISQQVEVEPGGTLLLFSDAVIDPFVRAKVAGDAQAFDTLVTAIQTRVAPAATVEEMARALDTLKAESEDDSMVLVLHRRPETGKAPEALASE